MSFANFDKDRLIDIHAATEAFIRDVAAKAIMPYYRELRASQMSEKTPGELVTVADHKAEEMLTEGLETILPQSRVIGEEACAEDPTLLNGADKNLVWVVDPLDGTAHFAAGHEPFGIMVALALDGVILASWIYNPVPDRMCYALLGQGAYIRESSGPHRRLRTRAPAGRPIAALATQFMPQHLRNSLVAAAQERFELQPIPRCAAEHYPRLCLGRNDIALFQRTLPWDHAAGSLILTEAGGCLARWDGSPYLFHDSGLGLLAATSRALWDLASQVLLKNPQLHTEGRTLLVSVQ